MFDFATVSLLVLLVPVVVAVVIVLRLLVLRLMTRWQARIFARIASAVDRAVETKHASDAGALLGYLSSHGIEFLCCEFAARTALGIDQKALAKDLTEAQRAAIDNQAALIEDTAERLAKHGLLAPFEESFDFRSPEGLVRTQACRTPGVYSLTAAGRMELKKWKGTASAPPSG